jgi:pSer/pThr/pTyr-binding forkhead associated (FHA) protein
MADTSNHHQEDVFVAPVAPARTPAPTTSGNDTSSSSSNNNNTGSSSAISQQTVELKYRAPIWSAPPPVDKGEQYRYSFEVLKEGSIIDTIGIHDKAFYLVGRLPICDIALENETISRQHAIIQHRETGNVYVYDLGSVHGTKVNKQVIPARKYIPIQPGDMIRFGASSRFFILGPAQPEHDSDERDADLVDQQHQQHHGTMGGTILNADDIEKHEAADARSNRWQQSIDFDHDDGAIPTDFTGSAWEAQEYIKSFQRQAQQTNKNNKNNNNNNKNNKANNKNKKRHGKTQQYSSEEDSDNDGSDNDNAGDPELSSRVSGYDYFLGRDMVEGADDEFLDRTSNSKTKAVWSGVGSKSSSASSTATVQSSARHKKRPRAVPTQRAESAVSIEAKLQVLDIQRRRLQQDIQAVVDSEARSASCSSSTPTTGDADDALDQFMGSLAHSVQVR